MTLDWHQVARAEFDAATDYYEEQADGLGDRFISLIEAATARITTYPLMAACFYRDCRRVRTEIFPYLIIYRMKGELIQIIAVMHTSRRPGYWKSRQ